MPAVVYVLSVACSVLLLRHACCVLRVASCVLRPACCVRVLRLLGI